MSSVDRRYQAKLAARASGKAEMQTYPSGPKPGASGFDRLSAEARYQAKLAARLAPPAPEPEPAPKPAEEAKPAKRR